MKFETISTKKVFQGRAFIVRQDQVRLPSDKVISLDIVDHPGAVTMLPIDEQERILFVRQYRHSTGQVLLELPAGTLREGEPPEACASREVREETGKAAGKLEKLGEFFLAPGYSTEYMYVYLAVDLKDAPLQADEDEFLSVEPVSIEEAFRMAETGQLRDAKSLAALLLLRPYLERIL